MPYNSNNLLESVISITSERDKKSLEKALIETLSEFISFDAIIMLRLWDDQATLEEASALPAGACREKLTVVDGEYGAQLIEADSGIKACLEHKKIITEPDGKTTRHLFPVIIKNEIFGLMAVYCDELSTHERNLIKGFLSIHNNFLAILNDNERDTLTGLLNRKTFDTNITELISSIASTLDTLVTHNHERRTTHQNRQHWLGILDIDHFKQINDNYGHIYGDEVLLLFSNLMKESFRNTDLLFRYGGEEFIVILGRTNEEDAQQAFNRFHEHLGQQAFPQIGKVTCSIGVVQINSNDHPTAIVERADKALYYAKEHGRNQTQNYHQLLTTGKVKERDTKDHIELFYPQTDNSES